MFSVSQILQCFAIYQDADRTGIMGHLVTAFEWVKQETFPKKLAMVNLLYIFIKENLLIPEGGFSRTPPKLEGLGE